MKSHSQIALSRNAFTSNLLSLKQIIGDQELALVIKSNAYGHGVKEIASMAEGLPAVTWLCTAGITESLHLRSLGIKKPLLVLSFLDASIENAIEKDIHLTVTTMEDALRIQGYAELLKKTAHIHIKIDTGMSRLGIFPEHALHFIQRLKELPFLNVYGIFTHLGDTANPDETFSKKQLHIFDDLLDTLNAAGIHIPCTHAQSSSALVIKAQRKYTFVRCGAAAYGLWKSPEHKSRILGLYPSLELRPVLEWTTRIIQIKHIPAGATVGYDRTFTAKRPTTLAIAPIGYWDGYLRSLSNKGKAFICGHLAPVAGIVSMNLTAFDVTDIPSIHQSDAITLLGGSSPISAIDYAKSANVITNEALVHINGLIERVIVPDHQPMNFDSFVAHKKHETTTQAQ